MHSHRDGTFRSRFGPWIFLLGLLGLLGLLAFGCSTPSTTRVEDDQGGKGLLSSIETVVTPEKTTIIQDQITFDESIKRLRSLEVHMYYPGHGTPFSTAQLET